MAITNGRTIGTRYVTFGMEIIMNAGYIFYVKYVNRSAVINMAVAQIFEFISDRSVAIRICTSANYAQKWNT
jgi:hypothetical protein